MLRDKLFDETQLYARLEAIVQAEDLPETRMALPYMREKHAGQYRVPPRGSEVQLPYYAHPALMACQAYAMGVKDDTILATALLHDVCEDCDVRPEELPFSEAVQTAVRLLTKGNEFVFTSDLNAVMEGYFAGIRTDTTSMFVKCLDRCNNLSTMAGSFSVPKMCRYIDETEEYILPLLNILEEKAPELSNAVFLLRYQMLALVETQKAFLKL